jgi:predicted hotdog family 3-hydroxylacyl-ACP dehydratase
MNIDLDTLLPHAKPMLLLDELVDNDAASVTCKVTIAKDSIFYDSKAAGIYAWVGIEYMAQAIGVFAGLHHYPEPPVLGLLLSVRKFKTTQALFKNGQQLFIVAHKHYSHDNIGVFNCEIKIDNQIIATATLNTIVPPKDKLDAILRGKKI